MLCAISLMGVLVACAPAAAPEGIPPGPPVIYTGSQEDVFSTIIQAISTDAGVPGYDLVIRPANYFLLDGGLTVPLGGSGAWIISSSDRVGGFVRATATNRGNGGYERVESISVVVSAKSTNPPKTQVVVQGTSRAQNLAANIYVALGKTFGASKD
jgi:hypothetical protein